MNIKRPVYHQIVIVLGLLSLMLNSSACNPVRLPLYDAVAYKSLTDLKPQVANLYDTFSNDPVDTNQVAAIRLKIIQLYEYEKGLGEANKATTTQVNLIHDMFERHVNDRMTNGKWNQTHLDNVKKNISDAFDIAITTEGLKNKAK